MDTKQYLSQISHMDKMINKKLVEISQLRELSVSISAVANEERVQTTPDPDRIGVNLSKIMDMEKEVDDMIDRFVDLKKEILQIINMIENSKYKKILFEKYFKYKSIYKIAEELEMTDRGCKKAHKRALEEFEKIINTIYGVTIDSSLPYMVES